MTSSAVSPRQALRDAVVASAQPTSLRNGVLSHNTNWLANTVTWSTRCPSRVAATSFIPEYTNYVSVLQLVGAGQQNPTTPDADPASTAALCCLGTFEHYYPPTKAMFSPAQYITEGLEGGDLLITSGDYLRLWHVFDTPAPPADTGNIGANADAQQKDGAAAASTNPDGTAKEGDTAAAGSPNKTGAGAKAGPRSLITAKDVQTMKQPTKLGATSSSAATGTSQPPPSTSFCAPLTSFDWNLETPNVVATSSIDTTVSVWDLEKRTVTIQIQAHDKEVFDVAFAEGRHIFASAGADGSVRVFDLRKLENCTIVYESADVSPMLRVAWNPFDPAYVACITENATQVTILDLRYPFVPVANLQGFHTEPINAIAWSPHSSSHLVSAGEDGKTVIWDINNPNSGSAAGGGHHHGGLTSGGSTSGGAQHSMLNVNEHPMIYDNHGQKIPVNGAAWKPSSSANAAGSAGGTSAAASSSGDGGSGAERGGDEIYVAISCGCSVQVLCV